MFSVENLATFKFVEENYFIHQLSQFSALAELKFDSTEL